MHYVSLIVEFLRGRPAVVFWSAALGQAALWFVVPSLFYSAPPVALGEVLMVGRHGLLGSAFGPPLAFWLAELAFRIGGIVGVYLLAQLCVVVALWAVFQLGRAVVGARHAALAVLLMTGISVLSLQTVDFGPAVLALPLWALALLNYWRAIAEGRRGAWFMLAFALGLLLLTSGLGVLLAALLVLFTLADARARAAFRHVEPWLAMLLLAVVVAPYATWFAQHWPAALWTVLPSNAAAGWPAVLALAGTILLAHAGLLLLVALAGGWPRNRRERPPLIEDRHRGWRDRAFVYVFALAPPFGALALAGGLGIAFERIAPLVLLSGLAVVTVAGERIALYRERIVSFAWVGLLVMPPSLIVLGLGLGPWLAAADFKVAQPAGAMGRFFADSFQRRTGQPLQIVAGDQRLATLVALAAPSRPSVFLNATPERSPWVTAERLRETGGIVVWPAVDTIGAPPAALRDMFPGLVAEVPRVFERAVQGRLPLMRVGWAVIRPAAAPQPARQ